MLEAQAERFLEGSAGWKLLVCCHFADALSPLLLKRLLKVEGVQQNGMDGSASWKLLLFC